MTNTPLGDALNAHTRLTIREVLAIVKILRSSLYLKLQRQEFPSPVRSKRSVRWTRQDVLAYLLKEEVLHG